MARSDWILPRADAACGKAFHADRRSADGYRVALEFWNKATGHITPGSSLVTYRCKRCGGFHVGRKRTNSEPAGSSARLQIARIDAEGRAPSPMLEPLRLDDPVRSAGDGPRYD
jgi:hypothetical protein